MVRKGTFVVHIYGRDGKRERSLNGLVEIVHQGKFVSFRGFEALRAILSDPRHAARKGAGPLPSK